MDAKNELEVVVGKLKNNELIELNLHFEGIGNEDVKTLAAVLPLCQSLRSIILSTNYIGDEGTKALAVVLPQCRLLRSITLSENYIGEEGTKALATVLPQCRLLSSMDLSNNEIGEEGAKALAEVLSQCPSLSSLDLGVNGIRGKGAKALEKMLLDNTTLTSLKLENNPIEDLTEINTLTHRNQKLTLTRRQEFIFTVILLARSAKDTNPDSFWTILPRDIRFLILSFLNLEGCPYIGKTARQIQRCIQFILNNMDKCNDLIQAKQKIKLIEKQDMGGDYQFRFFKSPEISLGLDPEQAARKKQALESRLYH